MVRLDEGEKGILRYLGTYDDAVSMRDISAYLENNGYDNSDLRELRGDLNRLIKKGYIRSKTEGSGGDRDEMFYLAKFIGQGGREKRKLQGRGVIRDLEKLIERLSGAFFLLFGLGVIIYEGINVTGAVVSSSQSATPAFVLASALFVIGGILLANSFKKLKK